MIKSLVLFFIVNTAFTEKQVAFELSVIHINDFHARFEETNLNSGTCKNGSNCIGGFSRIYTAIKDLLKTRKNPIILNAGDNFQGTLWYNIHKWNVTQYFLNKLPTDAYTLGNHEFDDKIKGVVPFIEALKAPVLVANIDDSDEPMFQGIYKKSIVIERAGRRVGIIGVIASNTDELSSTGKLKFLNEIESVNSEAKRLVSKGKVDTIIVLSHCGYDVDQEMAKKAAPKIGLVVGGHSHTFLYTGSNPPAKLIPEGPYPTVIKHADGRRILIVQAAVFSQFLGDIIVQYDKNGDVVAWAGVPIYLDTSIKQDPAINKEIALWKESIDERGNEVIGRTLIFLDSSTCHYEECILGNVIADSMIYGYRETQENNSRIDSVIAVTNSGGIRTSIETGEITFNDLITTIPFEDTILSGDIEGKHIKEALEFSTTPYDSHPIRTNLKLLQVSGIQVVFNISKPLGYRVQSIRVRSKNDLKYEQLQLNQTYRIVVNSYIAAGGNGFVAISNNLRNKRSIQSDYDVLKSYIKLKSPIVQKLERRIKVIT